MKTKTITTITIILAVAVIILLVFSYIRIEQIKLENTNLKSQIKGLDLQLELKCIELKDTKNELTGVYQQLENISIKYISNQLYIDELESKYLSIYSYANCAESILLANNIKFYKTIGLEWEFYL